MDDFLHNLRSGNLRKSNTGNRRQYNDQHGRHPNRRVADRRQKDTDQRLVTESLETIKELLKQVATAQQQSAAVQEQRAATEARATAALERIAASLGGGNAEIAPAPAETPAEGSQPTETAPEVDAPRAAASSETTPSLGEKITALRAQKLSYARIADQLNAEGVPTPSGRGQWRGQTVQRTLQRFNDA